MINQPIPCQNKIEVNYPKRDGSQIKSLSFKSERETFLCSWLHTTRLLIGTEMGETKSNSVGRFIDTYQKQEINNKIYQLRHRHGGSQGARRGIKMINERIRGQSQNLKIRIK